MSDTLASEFARALTEGLSGTIPLAERTRAAQDERAAKVQRWHAEAAEASRGTGDTPLTKALATTVHFLICACADASKMAHDLRARVELLEQQLATVESGTAKFAGVYRSGQQYDPGTFATHGGSLWCARTFTSAVPGKSDAWQLCVKRGSVPR